jgi:predicted ATPase/class 3 adenylate cyclase
MPDVRPDLPAGTVTFVFTDVEGSTRLLEELGPSEYAQRLGEHRQLVRQAFGSHGGVEVDTQGDAFFYAFADAGRAVTAAADAQERLGGGQIRVRMGIHTGEPTLAEEGYVGRDVHLAARIAAAGHGGQVLISRETRAGLAESVAVTDLGEHRLKDFAAAVWIYQLGGDRFPPLRTISNTNLPRPASSFVGREREVSEIAALLRDGARLLTLTGPGGTGKTRLAIEAATELVPDFRNGVFWVDLAPLRDPALVAETIGQTLGAKDGLADHIGEREMLLLLDNLEQVVSAARELASLAETCPNLRLLVTSRERLRVRGEVEYAVPPLADADAVTLFCERAQLEPEEAIAELCRRLDDLPLAVELAAARTSVLAPTQILERLGKRLDLLKGGRDADPRQQTLRATIEWSHDLLDSPEQMLFRRLSVFRGGCTLEAAEDVCAADLDILASLVDKSLLRRSGERFTMLETIRAFATERLEGSVEANGLRRRHADYFAQLAEEAEPHLRLDEIEWVDRLEADHDNLRAVLDQLETAGDTQEMLELAGSLQRFWYLKSHYVDGRRRFERALAADVRPTAARSKALRGASVMALNLGDTDAARAWADQALEIDRTLGDDWGEAYSLMMVGNSYAEGNELATGLPFLEQSMAGFERLGDELYTLIAMQNVGWTVDELGDKSRARVLHEDLLRRARAIGNQRMEAAGLDPLGSYALDDGRLDEAAAMWREALRIAFDRGQMLDVAFGLARLAAAIVRMGRPLEAARLLGASVAITESVGSATRWWAARRNDETVGLVRQHLSDAEQAAATEEGRRLTLDEAVALALSQSPAASVPDQPRRSSVT